MLSAAFPPFFLRAPLQCFVARGGVRLTPILSLLTLCGTLESLPDDQFCRGIRYPRKAGSERGLRFCTASHLPDRRTHWARTALRSGPADSSPLGPALRPPRTFHRLCLSEPSASVR